MVPWSGLSDLAPVQQTHYNRYGSEHQHCQQSHSDGITAPPPIRLTRALSSESMLDTSRPEIDTNSQESPELNTRQPGRLGRLGNNVGWQHNLSLKTHTIVSYTYHLHHGLLAIFLVIASQFLIWGLNQGLKLTSTSFPPAIVGMGLVFTLMYWANKVNPRIEEWYFKYLGQSVRAKFLVLPESYQIC